MGSAMCCGSRPSRPQTRDEVTNTTVKGEDVYPIVNDPKGLVLILNNYFESDGTKRRAGSEVDVENMKRVWTDIGCKLHREGAQCDKTAAEMKSLIREVATVRKGEFDFVVIIIMSHGGLVAGGRVKVQSGDGKTNRVVEQPENVFYGSDLKPVKVRKIIEMFSNKNAENLQNIPKLFFFQFCQGDKNDEGIVQPDKFPCDDQDKETLITLTEVALPVLSDVLVAFPAQQEHLAFKTENGSWFINAVMEVFDQYARSEHVLELLTRVNGIMAKKHGLLKEVERGSIVVHVRCKAMSNFESSLTKKLYFYP